MVHTCFDRLEIEINPTLLQSMNSHLTSWEMGNDKDTDFDHWLHAQIYKLEYNTM